MKIDPHIRTGSEGPYVSVHKLSSSTEDTQDVLGGSYDGIYIGTGKAMAAGTFFSGLIDDVRIYNRAVSP
ncbi:MAG: LamG-like jellyroll fold domain-containing protein [Planctomycetota bacterium]